MKHLGSIEVCSYTMDKANIWVSLQVFSMSSELWLIITWGAMKNQGWNSGQLALLGVRTRQGHF